MKPKDLVQVSWDSCPECGCSAAFEPHSMAGEYAEEAVYDGETAYCISQDCDVTGWVSVDDERAYINWGED